MTLYNYSPRLNVSDTLRLLNEAKAFATVFGVERLDYLIGFSNNTESTSIPLPSVAETEILTEVEAIGLELNSTLVSLIVECSVHDVRYAIAVVQETRKRETLNNPEGLFYRVLENKRKSNSFGFMQMR
jgi:hypothetical protein